MKLSIITALYRSEETMKNFVAAVSHEAQKLTDDYEIIMVDDRSPDNSWKVAVEMAAQNPRLKCVRLSRNFGQQIAMSAGVAHATGDYLILMDADLQNPPEAIYEIVQRLMGGDDIVYTVSKTRNNFSSKLTSAIFWLLLTSVFKVKIIKNQLMLRGFSKRMADDFRMYPEVTRTVAGIVNDIGLNYSIIEVQNRKRLEGRSSYSFSKRFNLMLDIILNISNAPLNTLINIGLLTLLLTILASAYYIFLYFTKNVIPGFTSIILSIFFFGSLIVLILGIIGRYLANIYLEVRRRPLYLVDTKINL
jgi:glycosyltransferase involved in cell wall biosynthesis